MSFGWERKHKSHAEFRSGNVHRSDRLKKKERDLWIILKLFSRIIRLHSTTKHGNLWLFMSG